MKGGERNSGQSSSVLEPRQSRPSGNSSSPSTSNRGSGAGFANVKESFYREGRRAEEEVFHSSVHAKDPNKYPLPALGSSTQASTSYLFDNERVKERNQMGID